MEQSAYLISIAAGVFYMVASYHLLRLSGRTGERPELLLGLYFVASGQWYLLYNAPYLFGLEEFSPLVGGAIEWVYAAGIIPYLLFIRSTFRPDSAWATITVRACTLFLIVGAAASSLGGGFTNSIDDPGYLIEWVGYTVPCVWMCCEGAVAHATAKKRVRIDLCEPIVANRYLLFACFGFFQVAACAADLLWAHGNQTGAATSALADGLLGGSEIASVSVLWLAFFPPLAYRRWIDARAAIPSTPAEKI